MLQKSKQSELYRPYSNGSKRFFKTDTIFKGLSDFHKLVLSVFKAMFTKSKPKEIVYRNYRKVNENNFN